MRKYLISSIVSVVYIVLISFLEFGIKDDYAVFTFPSWPFLIGCFENCGYLKIFIATIFNGIILGLILLGILFVIERIKNR